MIVSVISGGQSGADLAGNVWAKSKGIYTEVRAFEGFRTQISSDQELYDSFKKLDYSECLSAVTYVDKLRIRTRLNVKYSNATLIFIGRNLEQTRGSKLTFTICKSLNRPVLVINVNQPPHEDVLNLFIQQFQAATINVAGERTVKRDLVIEILDQIKL